MQKPQNNSNQIQMQILRILKEQKKPQETEVDNQIVRSNCNESY